MESSPTLPAQDTGEARVEAIREDLACPDCDYNLRGLSGDVVDCPECGRRCDVAALVTARWTGKWYKAPGLNRVLWPTAAAVIGGIAAFMARVYHEASGNYSNDVFFWPGVVLLGTLIVWAVLMWRTTAAFVAPGWGLTLALLAHVLFVGYVIGVFTLVGGIIAILSMIATQYFNLWGPVSMAVGIAALWGSRKGERFIAACCIRQYLRDQTRTD